MVTRVRNVIRSPADVLLGLRVGAFVLRAPAELQRHDLRGYLDRLASRRRPPAPDVATSAARVRRLRNAWLRLPGFRRRNTCYVRALTLYRFLDAGTGAARVHFGVESEASPGGRLRGHAWVTVDGNLVEGPPDEVLRRVREMPIQSDFAERLEWDVLLACAAPWPSTEVVPLVERGPDWDQVLRLATWNRLSALLRSGLRGAGAYEQVPEAVRHRLTTAYHVGVAKDAARRRHLDDVLLRLDAEGIPAMLLKGAALAETVYREPGLRPMGDVDILVPDDDAERAHRALQDMGHVALSAHPEQHHHHLPPLETPDGLVIFELHRSLMPPRFPLQLDAARFWHRARSVDAPAPAHLLPAPEDLLLHVCVHFAQDRVRESEGALGQLCDIARLVRATDLDWDTFSHDIETPGVRAAVFLALVSAVQLLRVDVPDAVVSSLEPPGAGALVSRFIDERILRYGHRGGLSLTQLHPSSIRSLLRSSAEPAGPSRPRADVAGLLRGGALDGVRRTVRSMGRAGLRDLRLDRQLMSLYARQDCDLPYPRSR